MLFRSYPVIVGEKRDVDFFRGTVLPIDSENVADNIRKRTAVLIFVVIMVEIDGGRKIVPGRENRKSVIVGVVVFDDILNGYGVVGTECVADAGYDVMYKFLISHKSSCLNPGGENMLLILYKRGSLCIHTTTCAGGFQEGVFSAKISCRKNCFEKFAKNSCIFLKFRYNNLV